MIREEYEDLNPPRRKKLRTVEPYSLEEENEKLIRQNRELEKTVERLDFFNKLLEKEIGELKNPNGVFPPAQKARKKEFVSPRRRSRGFSNLAFYSLLLITLTLGSFAIYSLFFVNADYPFLRRIQGKPPVSKAAEIALPVIEENNAAAVVEENPKNISRNGAALKKNEGQQGSNAPADAAIINQPAAPKSKNIPQQNSPSTNAAENITESRTIPAVVTPPSAAAGNTAIGNANPPASPAEPKEQTPIKSAGASVPETASAATGNIRVPAPAAEEKKSLGSYKVVSKANFYSSPNENALSGPFIYQFSPVTLEALEETDNFILVIAKNNLGAVSKGWLSKKDLRRIDK